MKTVSVQLLDPGSSFTHDETTLTGALVGRFPYSKRVKRAIEGRILQVVDETETEAPAKEPPKPAPVSTKPTAPASAPAPKAIADKRTGPAT